jgi:hypothetical protein
VQRGERKIGGSPGGFGAPTRAPRLTGIMPCCNGPLANCGARVRTHEFLRVKTCQASLLEFTTTLTLLLLGQDSIAKIVR